MVISHDPPDYPVMNLEVARRGQAAHQDCDVEKCSAKAYFDKVALRLGRELRTIRSSHNTTDLRGAWNIWTGPTT
ncbi:hypothetical protein GFY24_09840 [Nocardia sp. SYP-A9097]|uniref:hypothetical protein n=1 Tax=Nocardia sp. SYP-A9097 TaxID=2663237 RepID=UPI00129BB4E8|nr:hypothetical protein [Nocardia sp. SYP-A9097]MRH87750.1 hypothetical protein [Nocardia sp. SYP-A9097]